MLLVESASVFQSVDFINPIALYADGGIVGKNGSPKAGTWAFRVTQNNLVVKEDSGILRYTDDTPHISNNVTELLAVIEGLKSLEPEWCGTIYSDSKITLGRVFCSWAMMNIPEWLILELNKQKRRLLNFSIFTYGLLSGHPTKAHLNKGTGKNGHLVSIHNQWCDEECKRQKMKFERQIAIQTTC